MNSLLMNYKHLEGAVLRTNTLLSDLLRTDCVIHSYLLNHGKTDIGVENFVKINSLLESYTKWRYIGDWTEVHDAFYMVKNNDNDIEVKTRVSSQGVLHIEHTTERILGDVAFTEPVTKLGIGIHVRNRTIISDDMLPVAVVPHRFVIIRRRSFHIGSVGLDGVVFIFHLSERYSSTGRTKCEEMMITKTGTTYEVCVECIKPTEYIELSDMTTMSLSMLLKMYDFISALDDSNSALVLQCVEAAL